MTFHKFRTDLGEPYGSFEVFHTTRTLNADPTVQEIGWFWWPCWPGCMPDADEATGPFGTEAEARDDAWGM